ncbi:hypothetical protein PV325_000196 [Microctonus aethiopoides]|nr:hypothetical protein PV325_000196 [Microctonus aethiopoides]
MNPSMEPGTSFAAEEPAHTKKKVFNDKWLNDPFLKDWLQASPDGNGAFCSVCTCVLSCMRYKLYQHAKTSKHTDNYITMKKTLSSAPVASNVSERIDIHIRLKTAAIELTSFFAEHNPDRKIVTQCFDMIELDRADCSASAIFTAFESVFEKQHIPLDNIISFASDNASVIIGKTNSFVTRLGKINPNLITLNCVCHSSALIASKACAQLPDSIYRFLNSVFIVFFKQPQKNKLIRRFSKVFWG